MDACPIDSTKRSRFGHTGSCGSKRRNCCQRVYATGASAMGVPGCPEFAACTPSMESVRMVLILVSSMDGGAGDCSAGDCSTGAVGVSVTALIQDPFAPLAGAAICAEQTEGWPPRIEAATRSHPVRLR